MPFFIPEYIIFDDPVPQGKRNLNDKIYTEKAVKEKKKGLMINEFKSLLLEIDPTLPQVLITTMFRN